MGLVREPDTIDFSVQSEPWSEEELKDFRKIMDELKAKSAKRKVLTTKRKKKIGD